MTALSAFPLFGGPRGSAEVKLSDTTTAGLRRRSAARKQHGSKPLPATLNSKPVDVTPTPQKPQTRTRPKSAPVHSGRPVVHADASLAQDQDDFPSHNK